MIKQKTFLEALKIFGHKPLKSKSYLKDKRLTISEKKILTAFILFRDNKLKQSEEVISQIEGSLEPIPDAMKNLIFGTTLISKSEFLLAVSLLEKANLIFIKYELNYFSFICTLNIFISFLNLKNKKKLAENLTLLEKFSNQSDWQKFVVERCRLNYYLINNDLENAKAKLDILEKNHSQLSENDKINFLISLVEFYVKSSDFDSAKKTLIRMKDIRKYQLTQNYNYIKILLDFLTNQSPIYFSAIEFKETPSLLNQLEFLKSLETQNQKEAKFFWYKLLINNPDIYHENFNYNGDINLFSLSLKKLLANQHNVLPMIDSASINSKYEALKLIFLNSNGIHLTKDYLYEQIWKTSALNKDDYNKLFRYIYRLKTIDKLEIKSYRGCYYLLSKSDQKAS